jgi:hypothetical protein
MDVHNKSIFFVHSVVFYYRELSQTNAELSQIIRELESKYLEFCQSASSTTKPLAQRKSEVRNVYMGQEEELAQSRKMLKAMNEYIHEMQTQCEMAAIELPQNERWNQFRGDRQSKHAIDSPPHKAVLRGIEYYNSPSSVATAAIGRGRGGGGSDADNPFSSRAAATAIILYEVKRLRQSMEKSREEAQALKKQV